MSAKSWVIAFLVVGAGLWLWQNVSPRGTSSNIPVAVRVPQLSSAAESGKLAFDANCSSCHGVNAAGTDQGPPLVHDIYNPGHHADAAFVFAAKQGVRRHHWSFGDMPPQPQVTDSQIAAIIQYVRELQAANGIGNRPHRM
jgi:mono/diheme cytochrome c family protein